MTLNDCFQVNRTGPDGVQIPQCIEGIIEFEADTVVVVAKVQLTPIFIVAVFHVDEGLAKIGQLEQELFFDLLVSGVRGLVQHDELFRNDAHLLEGDSLDLSSGEALDDPALLVLLHQVDLRSNKLNHDLVLDVGVVPA